MQPITAARQAVRRDYKINRRRGNYYNTRIHKPHKVDPEQAGNHNSADGYRHRQKQIVILCEVQPRIGIENAAEGTEKYCKQAHYRKIEPVKADRRQCAAKRNRQKGEHSAENTDH